LHFEVQSPLDPRLDDYRNVSDAELLQVRGSFVAEGRLVVRRLLTESALTTRSAMVTEAALGALADVLAASPDLPIYVVPQGVMNAVTGFNIHRGCLAIGARPAMRAWHEVAVGGRTVLVLERISNADNVGGLFRNAAAFGADAVLLDGETTDPLYRKAIRTSMGASLVVPWARVHACVDTLVELKAHGVVTLGLTPSGSASEVRSALADVAGRPLAIVLGHEGEGLTGGALDACELRARIPTTARVDSLNVATAAAVALYERSRSLAGTRGRPVHRPL
jgi:tRNA G18 (ribose-2'-O)-methylase SpoU